MEYKWRAYRALVLQICCLWEQQEVHVNRIFEKSSGSEWSVCIKDTGLQFPSGPTFGRCETFSGSLWKWSFGVGAKGLHSVSISVKTPYSLCLRSSQRQQICNRIKKLIRIANGVPFNLNYDNFSRITW